MQVTRTEHAELKDLHEQGACMAQCHLWRRMKVKLNDLKNGGYEDDRDCVCEIKRIIKECLAAQARKQEETKTMSSEKKE